MKKDYQKKREPFDVTKKYSAYSYATFLLAKRDYSIYKLSSKLKEKGYPQEDIDATIERMRELKYLDDERFVTSFVRNKRDGNGWGASKIRQELSMKHGVDNDLIASVLEEYDFDDAKLKQYIKKYGVTAPDDSKEYQKRMGFLARKGFSPKIPSLEELQEYQDINY